MANVRFRGFRLGADILDEYKAEESAAEVICAAYGLARPQPSIHMHPDLLSERLRQEEAATAAKTEPVDHVAEKIENERKSGGFDDHDRIGEHR